MKRAIKWLMMPFYIFGLLILEGDKFIRVKARTAKTPEDMDALRYLLELWR